MLIEKAGDTTNNITTTNNIQINSYGHEDMSYITEKMLNRLVVHPNTMIADLVKLTHFHKDHPENKNLKITNKKDKYIKVYKNDEWKLDKRDIVIDNIMHNKCTRYPNEKSTRIIDTYANILSIIDDKDEIL